MKDSQKIILQIGAAAAGLLALFPPLINSTYAFVFSVPVGYQIDLVNLLLRIFVVIAASGVAWIYFGITVTQYKENLLQQTTASTNIFNAYFLGQKPLWKAFWLIAVLGCGAITFLTIKITSTKNLGSLIFLVSVWFMYVYNFWSLVSLWRCAQNTKSTLIRHSARFCVLAFWVIFLISTSYIFWH